MANPPELVLVAAAVGLTLRALMPWGVALLVYFTSGRDPKVFAEVAKFRPRPPWQR